MKKIQPQKKHQWLDIDKDDSKPEDTESDGDDEIDIPKVKPSAYQLMVSKTTGNHYIVKDRDVKNGILCPEKYVELAKKNPLLAIEKLRVINLINLKECLMKQMKKD